MARRTGILQLNMNVPAPIISPSESLRRRREHGRDELNLADFPISVSQWQQPRHDANRKVDEISYLIRRPRQLPRTVTLAAPSRIGLPTPGDETVLLGLLCLAKEEDFRDTTVRFVPYRLFQILGWSGSSKHYQRLRTSIERLQKLSITYERTWFDKTRGQLLEQHHTGLVSEGYVVTPKRGRHQSSDLPQSWIRWTDTFYASLRAGNIKRLDLNTLFELRLPLAQRLYRHLDKHFYRSPTYELDLRDLAFGHLGMRPVDNIAIVKQRLTPAINELVGIGFIEATSKNERFQKHTTGHWRVLFRRVSGSGRIAVTRVIRQSPVDTADAATELVQSYHERRKSGRTEATQSERTFARECIAAFGLDAMKKAIPKVARIVEQKWPDAKTFNAVRDYLPAALKLSKVERRHEQRETEEVDYAPGDSSEEFEREWGRRWDELAESSKEEIRRSLRQRGWDHLFRRGLSRSVIIQHQLRRLCIEELRRIATGGRVSQAIETTGRAAAEQSVRGRMAA